jgi:hypothetical protein
VSPAVTTRRSLELIALGALAIIGGFVTAVYGLISMGAEGDWIPYVAHAGAALGTGAVMTGWAQRKSVREPLLAGAVAIGGMVVLFIAAPDPSFSWVAARAANPLGLAALIAVGTVAAAAAGSVWLGRRVQPGLTSLSLALLASAAAIGALLVAAHTAFGFFGLRL